jgi:cell wall-associated NlpC family hydrolase
VARCSLLVVVLLVAAALPATSASADTGPTGPTGGLGTGDPTGVVSPDGSYGLNGSDYNLSDVDPLTGALLGTDPSAALSDSAASVSDLADQQQLELDVLQRAEQARREAEAKRRAALAARGNGRLKAGTPYAAELEAAADAVGIEPALLAAVAQVESGFDPAVISCKRASSAGARGMMQFMPTTAAGYGIDPCNPAQAAQAAAKFLKELYDQFGSWDLAIAAYNAGPGAVRKAGNKIPNITETKNYVNKVNFVWAANKAAAAAEAGPGQTAVGPDGCPTAAPPNTLRGGSASVGIAKLCADSVAQARTPQAANAIKAAMANLGKPYSQPKRNSPGFFDCSSFVTRAYQTAGVPIAPPGQNAPTTKTIVRARWAVHIPLSQVRPGDLIEPTSGHVAMALADGFVIHTNATGDVSHVRSMYSSAYAVVWVDPSKA